MKNILIIEDEPQAAQRLETLVKELIPDCKILAKLDTVKKAVRWFSESAAPDFVFMDIQLADGISFQIFEQAEVNVPVIFTTAYDEYALKAFKVNSIDYILKPVDKEDLQAALNKLKQLSGKEPETKQMLDHINDAVSVLMKRYKSRFVIRVGEHLKTVETDHIRYFFSQDKTTFCVTDENRNFILDYTLEQVEDLVDPELFFRINRKYLVRAGSIQDIIQYTNSRLRLVLKGSSDSDVIVARERVQQFKEWLDR